MDTTKNTLGNAGRIGQQLGNHRLIGLLEQGKFSGSYLGEHISSRQQVVVNVLQPMLADDLTQSFLQQTYTLGQLSHPHILPLREAGRTEDHLPFLVFDSVPHVTLQQLHPKGTAYPLARIFPDTQQIAAALQYAHDHGILHQRVHPGNILQTTTNEILVCDFTIDALVQNKQRHSSGQIIDNIAYAAPEQIRGKACPASDQYSLAIMIYEWLSGDLPFHGSPVEIMRRHAHVPPPSLRQKAPIISTAIEEVIFTALAKDPAKRFASISAFINALEQTQKPGNAPRPVRPIVTPSIQPTPATVLPPQGSPAMTPFPPQQTPAPPVVQPPMQVHYPPQPAPVAAQNVFAAPPVAPIGKGQIDRVPVVRPKKQEMTMTRRAFAMGFTALALAGGAGGWLALSRQLSHKNSGPNTSPDVHNTIGTPDAKGARVLIYRAHPARVTSVAWSPDGKLIASASDDKLIAICNSGTGTTLRTYRGHTAEVYTVTWSPDGKLIASAGADKTVQIWNATTGTHLLTYTGHTGAVNGVSWSADGTQIASASEDKTVQVWNVSTGTLAILYSGHTAGVLSVAWSPDNTLIASGSWDNTLQAFSTIATEAFAVGDTVFSYGGHSAEVYAITWSPDGASIASASGDKTVQISNGIDGKTQRTYKGHSNIVLALSWSPDGKHIASGSADTTVQIWNPTNAQKTFTYHGHNNSIFVTAWSPDNKRIASGSSDNTMQVWQIP